MEKLCLVGAGGRMGSLLYELKPDWFICGIDIADSKNDLPVYSSFDEIPEEIVKELNGILDFSNPKLYPETINFALKHNLPVAVGTTGLTESDLEQAQKAGEKIPVLVSSNMSIGVNSILSTIADLVNKMGDDFDVEIIEKHHNQKVDAPSGTALLMADTINNSSDTDYTYVFDRSGKSEPRKKNEIGIISLRGGTLPGEHSIILAGTDEVVELKHTAYSRKIFAQGALKGIAWLIHQKPGFYTYQDVINE